MDAKGEEYPLKPSRSSSGACGQTQGCDAGEGHPPRGDAKMKTASNISNGAGVTITSRNGGTDAVAAGVENEGMGGAAGDDGSGSGGSAGSKKHRSSEDAYMLIYVREGVAWGLGSEGDDDCPLPAHVRVSDFDIALFSCRYLTKKNVTWYVLLLFFINNIGVSIGNGVGVGR